MTHEYVCMNLRGKSQNEAWVPEGGNPPQMARRCRSSKKVLYTIFCNSKGDVLQKPCKSGESTGKFYRDSVLSWVKKFYEKAGLNTGLRGIIHLHDDAPSHESHFVQEYLAKENIETLPHPLPPLTLLPVTFSSSHISRNASQEEVLSPSQPPELLYSTIWRIWCGSKGVINFPWIFRQCRV